MLFGREDLLEFVIHNKDKRSSNSSENVRESSLEERLDSSFVGIDFSEAIEGSSVKDISSSRLHHKTSSDGIKRVGDNS